MKKRRWIGRILLLLFLLPLWAGVQIYYETHYTRVAQVYLQNDKIPAGQSLRIVQISDLHAKRMNNLDQLLTKIRQFDSHMIVLTGDMIDVRTTDYSPAQNLIQQLVAIQPQIYFVSGNHEEWNKLGRQFIRDIQSEGVRVMDNSAHTAALKNFSVILHGVGYAVGDGKTYDGTLTQITGKVEEKDCNILLSHSPVVSELLKYNPFDVILSGHTHGGQVRIPFFGGVLGPDGSLFPRLDRGVYPLKNGRYLYIDSGMGTSMAPVRFFNQSQVSFITLEGHG